MKARKWTALVLTLLLLFGMLPTVTAGAEYGIPEPTDSFCPYSTDGRHSWGGWKTVHEATCASEGSRVRACENGCGYKQTENIPRLEHDWGGWKTLREATCTAAGEQTRACGVCGQTETRAIDMLPHSYDSWTVTKEATCTETGIRTRRCKACGNVEQDTIARLPHTWGEWQIVTAATDHSAGERARTCEVCGTSENESFDPEGTLRRGARGEAVKRLQEGLICYGVLKAGGADGRFGPGTEGAVKQVQEAEGFAVDGVAWPQTQAVLGHRFGDWQVLSVKTDFSIGLRRRVCDRCGIAEEEEDAPSPMYRRGDKGDGVRALQQALNAAGFNSGAADGDFGGKTEAAVKAFEEANGIEPDGIAWPGVLKLLNGDPDIDYGEAEVGRIRLTAGDTLRGASEDAEFVTQLTVANTGDSDLDVWVRVKGLDEEMPIDGFFGDWPEDGEGSVRLAPGEERGFRYLMNPTAEELESDWIERTVTAEGIDPVTGQGFVSSVVLGFPLQAGEQPDAGGDALIVELQAEERPCTAGETVQVGIRVKNAGSLPMTQLSVSAMLYDYGAGEYGVGEVLEDLGDARFLPGEIRELAYQYVVTDADVERGELLLTICADARTESEWLTTTADLHLDTYESQDAGSGEGMIVSGYPEKTTFGPGDTLTVYGTIANTGDEAIEVYQAYSENMLPDYTYEPGVSVIPQEGWRRIEPGESRNIRLTYDVTDEDVARGWIGLRILARARGVDSGRELDDGVNFSFTMEEGEVEKPMAALSITDVHTEERAYAAGEFLQVNYRLTNVGAEPLSQIGVQLLRVEDDDILDDAALDFPELVLEPDGAANVTINHVVTEKEAAEGYIYLLVRAEGTSTGVGAYCADTVEFVLGDLPMDPDFQLINLDLPALIVTAELTDPDRAYRAGEPVPMDITVICLNSTRLEKFEVWLEPMYAGTDTYIYEYIEGVGSLDTYDFNTGLIGLNPHEIWEKYHDGLVFPEVVAELGSFDVDVVAQAQDPETGEYCEVRDRITVHTKAGAAEAALKVTAKAQTEKFAPGVSLKVDLNVKNTGSVPVRGLSLSLKPGCDGNKDGKAPPFASWPGEIAPGAEWNTTFSYTPALEDVNKNQLHFTFRAKGKHSETGEVVTAGRECYVLRATDAVGLTLTAEPLEKTFLPEKNVLINLTATNTGTVPLKRLLLDDELPSQATFGSVDTLLSPGESCSAMVPVHPTREIWNQNKSGWNLSWTLRALSTTGKALEATANATLKPDAESPLLSVTAEPDSWYYVPGVPVYYTITVQNTGNVALEDVHLLDGKMDARLSGSRENLLKPGQKRTAQWFTMLSDEDWQVDRANGTSSEYSWMAIGESAGEGRLVEGTGGFTLSPAGAVKDGNPGLRVTTEQEEGAVYALDQTATVVVRFENISSERIRNVRICAQQLNPGDNTIGHTTLIRLNNRVYAPGETGSHEIQYPVKRLDVSRGRIAFNFIVMGESLDTGMACYDTSHVELKTTRDYDLATYTGNAWGLDNYDGSWQLTLANIVRPVDDLKAQFGLELSLLEVSREDDIVTAKIRATNQSDVPLTSFGGGGFNPVGPHILVEDSLRLQVSGGAVPLEDADIGLAPGESFEFIYQTTINGGDYALSDAVNRTISLIGSGEGDIEVVGLCQLRVPLEIPEELGFRLSLGNVVRDRQMGTILQKLRLENPTDEELEIHMSMEAEDDSLEDGLNFQWQGSGSGVYFVNPGETLDFGAWLQPTQQEAEDGMILRWITAAGADEAHSLIAHIPLQGGMPMNAMEIACSAADGLADGAFNATYSVLNTIPDYGEDDLILNIKDARVKVQVLAPDGSCLDTLTLDPEETGIGPGGKTAAYLQYELTPEQRALGSITFLAWAEGVLVISDDSGELPIFSWNTWTETVATDGLPEVTPGDLSVSISLPEGDRLYRAGEPIPLAFEITPEGDHPLEGLTAWLDPVDTGTDSFIYEYFGDLMLDTSAYAEGFGPGDALRVERYEALTLPIEAARSGGFDMKLIAGAKDPATGEYFERSARVHVRTVDNNIGLVLILEPNVQRYTPELPVVFRVGVKNEGSVPFDGVDVDCRRGTLAQANVPNWVEVVFQTDEPIQPGETVWREDFLCWPTIELEGGTMYAHFRANTWAGREHALTDRMLVFPMAQPAGISLAGEADADTFAPDERIDCAVNVKNTGGAALMNCEIIQEIIPAQGETSRTSFPLFEDNRYLWPGSGKRLPLSCTPDGSEGDSITLKVTVTGHSVDTGETVTAEWTHTLTRAESDLPALSVECELEEERIYEANETAYVTVTVRNDGEVTLGEVTLDVDVARFGADAPEGSYIGTWDGLEPGNAIVHVYPYTITDGDVASGAVRLNFMAHSQATDEIGPKDADAGCDLYTRDLGGDTIMYDLPTGMGGSAEGAALSVSGGYGADGYGEGDELTFQLELRNTGERPLTQLSAEALLRDEENHILVDADIASWSDWSFEPSDTLPFGWGYSLTAEDVTRGFVRATFIGRALDAETFEPVFAEFGVTVPLPSFTGDGEADESGEEGDVEVAPPEITVPPETTAPPEITVPAETTAPPEITVPPETTAPPETAVPPETGQPEPGQPEAQPEPTPTASEAFDVGFCRRRLTGWGEGVSQFELIGCAEHRQMLEAFAETLTGADNDTAALLRWQAAKGILTVDVNEEYDRLNDALPGEAAKALLAADRDSFFAQLDALEALMASTANPAIAARLVSEQLVENLIDLCCVRHTAPAARADSLLEREYARLAGAEAVLEGCQIEYSGGAEGSPVTRTETLCQAHADIDRRLEAAIFGMVADAAVAEAFRRAQRDWEAALRRLGRVLARTADTAAQEAVTADLFAFHDWQIAREALLAELYPGSSSTAAEIVAQTIRRRVIGMEAAFMQP